MELGGLILSLCLVLQQPPARSPVPPAREEAPSAGPLVPVEDRKPKLTPPRLITEALTPPAEGALAGRPITLLDVLNRSGSRPQQLAAVQAYWTLAGAVGDYNFCLQEQQQLKALAALARAPGPGPDKLEAATLAAELALVSARVHEARVRAIAAQVDLAQRLRLSPGEDLPLPADLPHIGAYRTEFEALFANRVAPPRLQLLDRTIPLRRKAIDVRAEAVQAAVDSIDAAREAFQRGQMYAESVAERMAHAGRQRKAFLETVREYNHEIAEYALAVAAPDASPASLLTLLIKPRPTESTSPGTPDKPTTTSPPAGTSSPAGQDKSAGGSAEGWRSVLQSDASRGGSAETRYRQPAASGQTPPVDVPPTAPADHESYAALLELEPPQRTHRLARSLHWDRSLGNEHTTITLDQCLAAASPANRRQAVEAFWAAREQAARCQVRSDANDQLAALYAVVLTVASQPGGAEAMLDLRAHQQAAEADLLDEQARLLQRRLDLATVLGRDAQASRWPFPITPPHGGRYEMKLEAQPEPVVQTLPVRSLATTVPGLYAALSQRADAVVRLDLQRAAAVEALQGRDQRVDVGPVLDLVGKQAAESLAFLSTLTRYNLGIAEYAMTVLPGGISSNELAAAMVVRLR